MAFKMGNGPLKLVRYTSYSLRNIQITFSTVQFEELISNKILNNGELLQSTDTPDLAGERFDALSE